MLAFGFGFFQILYAIGAILFGADIYHWLVKRGQPTGKALMNTALAVVVLLAVVELPFGFLMTIPYLGYVVGGVAFLMIARGVYKIYRLINGNGSTAAQPPKKS